MILRVTSPRSLLEHTESAGSSSCHGNYPKGLSRIPTREHRDFHHVPILIINAVTLIPAPYHQKLLIKSFYKEKNPHVMGFSYNHLWKESPLRALCNSFPAQECFLVSHKSDMLWVCFFELRDREKKKLVKERPFIIVLAQVRTGTDSFHKIKCNSKLL